MHQVDQYARDMYIEDAGFLVPTKALSLKVPAANHGIQAPHG